MKVVNVVLPKVASTKSLSAEDLEIKFRSGGKRHRGSERKPV